MAAAASEVMLENFAAALDEIAPSLDGDHFRVTRAAKKKCPPVKVQNGFSPFAFLAFILISINTIMNISNNISNNNNNRNNNNNDNNNNNLFSSNNVNMRRSFDEVPDSGKLINFLVFRLVHFSLTFADSELIEALRSGIVSPWSPKLFETLRRGKEKRTLKAPELMHRWLYLVVVKVFPKCLLNFSCQVSNTFQW